MNPNFARRFERVITAIHADPGADWSLDQLADIAALSRFHFHRAFAAATGETVAEAVRRVRMHHASYALTRGDAPVAQVARAVGYTDAAAFGRAFRQMFGQTPAQFRRNPRNLPPPAAPLAQELMMYAVTLQTEPDRRLLGLAHIGPYERISQTFDRLGPMAGAAGLFAHARGMAAVYLDDPAAVPPERLRSVAGLIIAGDVAAPEGFEDITLPGGAHAVLDFRGPYVGLAAAYRYLYGPWLADSGRVPADAPSWELYVNDPRDTRPEDLVTHLHLPLAE